MNSLKRLILSMNLGLRPLLLCFILALLFLTCSRTFLLLWQSEGTQDHILDIYGFGLRYDLSILGIVFSPLYLVILVVNILGQVSRVWIIKLSRLYLTVILSLLCFFEITTPPFVLEYGVRPNHLYLEYLIYPKEVMSMLANGHILESIICLFITVLIIFLVWKLTAVLYRNYRGYSKKTALLMLALGILIIPWMIRGTFGHKPLNPSSAAFSQISFANDIAVNSAFSLFYNLRHINNDSVNEDDIYAFDTAQNILLNLPYYAKREISIPVDPKCPLNQTLTPTVIPQHQPNVVVILLESLGSTFVGKLNGLPATPNLELLAQQGWWFDNLYATGHRSVRGIEAVTASFPPSPLTAQVRLQHLEPITTLPLIFELLGYKTSFIYGGESHFDNMRRYFLDNGVQEVIDQNDYQNPSFVASWGVSDEDLFKKANERFVELSQNNEPFFSLVFTSSFHDPFDIPEGKVALDGVTTDDPKRFLAAKYSDYALGEFFKQAQQEDYYTKTIFLIIADHDSKVRDFKNFPINNYLIPGLILGPNVKPREDKRLVSQIDMLPTLLSLAGVSGQFPIVGQDLTQEQIIQRAPIAYNSIYGYLSPADKLVLLMPPHYALDLIVKDDFTLVARKPLTDAEVSRELSFLNIPLVIFENNYNAASCIKDLKQQIASQ